MAFSMGGSGNGLRGRRRFGGSNGVLSEMNVVPLVDVVLVLLIIFMLTAHVMDYGMEVEVPRVKVTKQNNEVLPVVTVSSNQTLRLNNQKVNLHDLAAQLKSRFKGQDTVYVACDKSIRWDLLAQVVGELGSVQMKVKLVTKPMDGGGQ
jgi:biopolymer transport protein ExbD